MVELPVASILITFISVVWFIVALLLIFIILIQKGKGGGLGGAFGGAGGGGGLLGTKTGDFLTWVTISLVFLFFFLAVILVKFGKDTSTSDDLKATPQAPQTTGTPAGNLPAPTEAPTPAATGEDIKEAEAPVVGEDVKNESTPAADESSKEPETTE